MKLKTNLFERITQHFVDDGLDIHWWIDDDFIDEFKEIHSDSFDSGEAKITDTRIISGKEWNEFWIGGCYGDYEGVFVNEECDCGHLLVNPEKEESPNARFCSSHDCDFINEEFKKYQDEENAKWEEIRNKPPEMKIRLAGEDIFEFCKRVGLQMDKKTGYFIKDNNYWTDCVVCKRDVPASDYFIGQDSGFATVHFSHDDCTNGGPSVGVPFKKETKEEWGNLLGGII